MTTPTGRDHDLLTIIAALRAKPGKEQQLRQAAEAVVEPTRHEEGCIAYHLHQAIDDPTVFYFYENWAGPEALDAHMKTPHFQNFVATANDLLAGPIDIQRLRRIT
ncbi:putative quinol monooxygenase [Planosporangium mesophilum]|uniref:putative quinol monooxygenase n=1 Tax=Planosporangium mesophilum TaxID=689768 RepID=UPI00143C9F82|nr:putative quinol monooxygenase [Planosporangium mesophilum]NJC86222.1 antibiotic biosynthesis monooxygenase [Planosporangium mesophilum]